MEGYKRDYMSMFCTSHTGPLVLLDGSPSAEDLYLAASITARYGQGRDAKQVDMLIKDKDGSERTIQVKPLAGEKLPEEWVI